MIEKYAPKVFSLIERYIGMRIVFRIAYALIAAGLSVLGFSNIIPYLAVVLRPELASSVDLQLGFFSIVGVLLIISGAVLPVFVMVFDYFALRHKSDTLKLNEIFALCSVDYMQEIMQHIKNNLSQHYNQQDLIEDLSSKILATDFILNNTEINEQVKILGHLLRDFDYKNSMRMHDNGLNSYAILRTHITSDLNQTVANECTRILEAYRDIWTAFQKHKGHFILRFLTYK